MHPDGNTGDREARQTSHDAVRLLFTLPSEAAASGASLACTTKVLFVKTSAPLKQL